MDQPGYLSGQTDFSMLGQKNISTLGEFLYNMKDKTSENAKRSVGIASARMNPHQADCKFVVGTESGGILICHIGECDSKAIQSDKRHELDLDSPVRFALSRHYGYINSLDWSAFHPNLLVSIINSRTLQLYHTLRKSPLASLTTDLGGLTCIRFCPTSPCLLAVTSENSVVSLYRICCNYGEAEYDIELDTGDHNSEQDSTITSTESRLDSEVGVEPQKPTFSLRLVRQLCISNGIATRTSTASGVRSETSSARVRQTEEEENSMDFPVANKGDDIQSVQGEASYAAPLLCAEFNPVE
ncbi:unnamed protein product [Protopolystoma xenopodis]|uniref:Uncharacterized protein n=1 Tax=Protopolystoma xenopodis TaxID=117903 RepID=A0A3S5B6S0_9PLAT|nr:unnamed protein product [Protopolystoma xenopodis]